MNERQCSNVNEQKGGCKKIVIFILLKLLILKLNYSLPDSLFVSGGSVHHGVRDCDRGEVPDCGGERVHHHQHQVLRHPGLHHHLPDGVRHPAAPHPGQAGQAARHPGQPGENFRGFWIEWQHRRWNWTDQQWQAGTLRQSGRRDRPW